MKTVKIKEYDAPITEQPVCGFATLRAGKLVFVTGGAWERNGRISNHFTWRPIAEDGTLGQEEHGYW